MTDHDHLRELSPDETTSELVLDLIDQNGGLYVLTEERHEELISKYGMDVLLLVVHEGDRVVLRAVALEEGPEEAGKALLAMGASPAEVAAQVARFRAAMAVHSALHAVVELHEQQQRDRKN